MTLWPDPQLALPFPPLAVSVRGRAYAVTPVFEPLYAPTGRLVALEMLTRLRPLSYPQAGLSPARFFFTATSGEAWRVFVWQVGVLTQSLPWFARHRILVSLNVNRIQARGCLANGDVFSALCSLSPWLRIEINEHFIRGGANAVDDPLLRFLEQACPLWLDDFGCGSANLLPLLTGRFEVIKVDRAVLDALAHTPSGLALLDALLAVANEKGIRAVLEGVETYKHLACVRRAAAWAFQGWLWPAVDGGGLSTLAQVDPLLAVGAPPALPDVTPQPKAIP